MPFISLPTRLGIALRVERRRRIRRTGLGLGVAILVWGCDPGSEPAEPGQSLSSEPVKVSQALVLESLSEGRRYRIRARPAALPLKLHQMHNWIVAIERTEGSSEIPTALQFDGGMPSHGHGFVTRPRVTQNLGNGEFLVEGVKFHMPGEWVLLITVTSRAGSDQVTLPLKIEP